MSRCYEMTIRVTGHFFGRYSEIVDAVADLGYEADNDISTLEKTHIIQFCSETINITAGHSDKSVSREIVEAIWKANGAFCKVYVGMRDLDADFPQYSGSKETFDEWQRNRNG